MPTLNRFSGFAVIVATFAMSAIAWAEEARLSRVSGDVMVTADSKRVLARAGLVVRTPVQITTAANGSVRVELPGSIIDVGPNSTVAVPGAASSTAGELIQQSSGRAVYSVEPRRKKPFTVRTPYLVSVVKHGLLRGSRG